MDAELLEKSADRKGKRPAPSRVRNASVASEAAALEARGKSSVTRKPPIASVPRKAANPFKASPAEVKAFAIKAGIITPAGKLTASYK